MDYTQGNDNAATNFAPTELRARVMAEVQGPAERRTAGGVTEGAISSATLPDNWQRTETINNAMRRLTVFQPRGDDEVAVSVHEAHIPVNQQASTAFGNLLRDHATQPYTLLKSEIKAAEPVLNILNAGDNQFTATGNRQPAFNLTSCRIDQINGKPVMVVEGRFGQNGTLLKGLLIQRDAAQGRFDAISFEAPDQGKFLVNTPAFNSMLRSIRWK